MTAAKPARKPDTPADELPFWRRKAMKDMTKAEWESLCDGCGRCCLNKLQEEGSERTYFTDVACTLLDCSTARELGLTTTGHASRGVSSSPSPSASNLHLEAGAVTPAEFLRP